jgi:hypothetical protein
MFAGPLLLFTAAVAAVVLAAAGPVQAHDPLPVDPEPVCTVIVDGVAVNPRQLLVTVDVAADDWDDRFHQIDVDGVTEIGDGAYQLRVAGESAATLQQWQNILQGTPGVATVEVSADPYGLAPSCETPTSAAMWVFLPVAGATLIILLWWWRLRRVAGRSDANR